MGIAFRHSAGFGKRMEYYLIGKMLMEGLDCYVPLVDDHGVDCIIKKHDGTFVEVQIKARSRGVTDGDAALFAAISHEFRPNFYFVFFSERLDNTCGSCRPKSFLKNALLTKPARMQAREAFGSTETVLTRKPEKRENIAKNNSKNT